MRIKLTLFHRFHTIMAANAWENPYVNVLKHFKVGEWKRASKSGDVSYVMDRMVQSYVYKILGSTPAANYIQVPGKTTRSLGLTGRYCYVLFKLVPTKAFVIHLDLVTKDDLIIRVSFSNIFKEFKFTSTWLQFPFIYGGEKGSAYEHKSHRAIGPTTSVLPPWTCLVLDLLEILSVYLCKQYSSLKAIKVCSCLLLKNIFTSDVIYFPGISFLEAKRRGLTAQGLNPMPRDMAFPVPKGRTWQDMYDYVRCPNNGSQLAFDSKEINVHHRGRSLEHGGSLLKEPHTSESYRKLPRAMKPCTNHKKELFITRTLPQVHFEAMPKTGARNHRDKTFHQGLSPLAGTLTLPEDPSIFERYCGWDSADDSCTHDHGRTATPSTHDHGHTATPSPEQRQRLSTRNIRALTHRPCVQVDSDKQALHTLIASPRMTTQPGGHSKTRAGTTKVTLGGNESSTNAVANRASRSSAKLVKHEGSVVVEKNGSHRRGVSAQLLNHVTADVPSARHPTVRAPPKPTSYRHFLPYLNNSGSFNEQSNHDGGKQPIHLKSILGYNGNARANIVWYTNSISFYGDQVPGYRPELLAYSCGRTLILEELQSGKQTYLAAHTEEISTLARSHDSLVLASASGTRDWTASQMCLWDVHKGTIKKTFQHFHCEVQAMAFSADDKFLLSAGDYRDGWLALWSMTTFERLARVEAPCPINDLESDLTDSDIFLCAGTQALLICHLDFHQDRPSLQVSMAPMPSEMDATELSSVAFSPHGVIYTGTTLGKVCAWNTRQKCCFLSWDADCGDIGVLLCRSYKILSGSERKKVKLWNVGALRNFTDEDTPSDTNVLLEQEMLLDGAVTAAVFGDDLDMGVVGTAAGTVWYIDWMDGSSSRLLSGHAGEAGLPVL
uniref:WD repeat-containing protein 90-like n=1 Tax=Myxine glutinosa TaxID=7769 RepID=UPI00359003D2